MILQLAPVCTLLPNLDESLSEHVIKKVENNPLFMTLVSTHGQFSDCLCALSNALRGGAPEIITQMAKAFELSCIPFAKLHLLNIVGNDKLGQKIWNDICLVGKVPKISNAFEAALKHLPQLRLFEIVFLEAPDSPPLPMTAPQSLKKTLRRCGLSPDVTALQTNINGNMDMERAQTMHQQFQSQYPMIHAEVQVIAHLLQEGSENVMPYLAVSTKPCFLCHRFAQQFHFATREPDYNQYSTWVLPDVLALSSDKVNKLADAARRLAGNMKAQLLIPIEGSQQGQEGGSASSGGSNDPTGSGQQADSELGS